MAILTLPTEIQEHILDFLPWHDHYLAASVCPLWLSILRTERFRRRRYYGGSTGPGPCTAATIYDILTNDLLFNADVPQSRPNPIDNRSPDSRDRSILGCNGLLGYGTLRLTFHRSEEQNILDAKTEISMIVYYLSRHGDYFALEEPAFDITQSPLLDSDILNFQFKQVQQKPQVSFHILPPACIRSEPGLSPLLQLLALSSSDRKLLIPKLDLSEDICSSGRGTMRYLIEAIRTHLVTCFFRYPGAMKCTLYFTEVDGQRMYLLGST
ncbi:hypothetical protein TWF281_009811 [Arthrobotrys megalospora]